MKLHEVVVYNTDFGPDVGSPETAEKYSSNKDYNIKFDELLSSLIDELNVSPDEIIKRVQWIEKSSKTS